ncbi:Aminoacyl-histidine dipeptidase (Peptidase D), partial [Olavius algarvensis spirochete endosymbiont]
KSRLSVIQTILDKFSNTIVEEFGDIEKNFYAKLEEASSPQVGLIAPTHLARLIDALRLIPHGVKAMYSNNLVETSMNFAVLRSKEEKIEVLANRRSARLSRGTDFSDIIAGLTRIYGGSFNTGNHYPIWEPNENSDALKRSRRIWAELFGTKCEVELSHAGLECGAIGERFPDLDLISFGPTILQAHSPDERIHIPSIGRVRLFLRELLKSY